MAPQCSSEGGIGIVTAIAIDRDKSSQYAVKWAVEHLLNNNHRVVLVHVRTQSLQAHDVVVLPKGGRPPNEIEMQKLFLPYRGFCARKGIEAKEVVLHDIEVSNALVDYISNHSVSNIVVGASNRNALTRKFRNADVPSSLLKMAPDFCTVYVIAKGKIQTMRSASRPATLTSSISPKQPSKMGVPQLPPDSPTSQDLSRSNFSRGSWRSTSSERRSSERSSDSLQTTQRDMVKYSSKIASPTPSIENFDILLQSGNSSSRDSISDGSDFSGPPSFLSTDMSSDNLEFSVASDSSTSKGSASSLTPKDLDSEMKRLKLELKQTMEMYNSACKEVVTAKQRARELHQWKAEEARKLEEARLTEEAAFAMAEMEKEKAKAALEAAQMAQRLAEIETEKRKHAEMKALREAEDKTRALVYSEAMYRKYSIAEIEIVTDYFSNSLKIGEGGYGPVYKALLDHTPVAIKVLRPDVSQGQKQFQQEVEILSCMRHPNMVLLVGACPEYGCLVYEYMDNGSLEDRLFRRNNTPPIPWPTRFKIASEIATALLFLHQTKPEPLVHRDLKPANILLDRNYVSKISDVGLARLVPPSIANSVTQYRMTAAAGTFCYIDPEYQQTGLLGVKSDIYSLGVMLLQIITARPAMGLAHQVEEAIAMGKFSEILDQTVVDWPTEEALSLAKMALRCCELRKKDRPDLDTVVLPQLNWLRDFGINSVAIWNEKNRFGSSTYNPKQHATSHFGQEGMRNKPNVEMQIQRRSMSEEGGSSSCPEPENGETVEHGV